MDRIVLYSGGPDSYITHFEVDRLFGKDDRILPVHFRLNHSYGKLELQSVFSTVPETAVVEELRSLGEWEEEDAYLYHRNSFLCLAASKLSEESTIYLSVQKDELSVPDRSPEFLEKMNELFEVLKINSRLESLWLEKDKTDMFAHYKEHGGRIEDLTNTWSCYHPRTAETPLEHATVHCGDCPACLRRYIAFRCAFGQDLTVYNEDPFDSISAMDYYRAAEEGKYSKERCDRIFKALESRDAR